MFSGNTVSICAVHKQRGAALLILLTIILMAASYTLLKRLNHEPVKILRAADDNRALGEAKAALFGYALAATQAPEKPGRLPCPDYGSDGDFDGNSDACVEQANFVVPGRLPWLTLGLSELRDSAGETLWYSPALELDGNPSYPINSNTATSLRLDGNPREVAAVIIAPGTVVNNQTRPVNFAAQDDPTRYLEDANSVADVNFVTVTGNPANDFNDQLAVIYTDELMQAVERRVLGELKSHLKDYYTAYTYYPYPAPVTNTACDSGTPQGHVPEFVLSGDCTALGLEEWPDALPGWFSGEGWNLLVWYAPAPACIQANPGCMTGGLIEVTNTPGTTTDKQAVLLAPGPAIGAQSRSPVTSITDLLDNIENRNGDMTFAKLPLDTNSNDQILVVAP